MTGGGEALRIELLGPLRVTVAGEVVDVAGPRRRAVLALLALAAGAHGLRLGAARRRLAR